VSTLLDQFHDAIAAAGLTPPGELIDDGKIHRFSSNGKPRDESGWYVLFGDGAAAGSFGCWREGFTQNWCSKSTTEMTQAEREMHQNRIRAMQAQREVEQVQRNEAAAVDAASRFKAATTCTSHPYLTTKGVQAHGVKVEADNTLLVPMRDTAGKLWNVERINPHDFKDKRGLPDGRRTGCFHSIGKVKDNRLIVGEGYATCASIHVATGDAVAVAFNAGNLEPVALAFRTKYPELKIIITADDDYRTDGNPGMTKATAAALAIGGYLAVPDFGTDRPDGVSDFNDLHRLAGLEAVKRCIDAAVPMIAPDPKDIIARIIESAKTDPTAYLTDESIEAFNELKKSNPMGYEAARTSLKSANSKIRIGQLDRFVAKLSPSDSEGSASTELVELAVDRCQLWHDTELNAYATFQREIDGQGHFEHWAVESNGFKEWLAWLAHTELGSAPSNEALSAAKNTIIGKAKFDGDEHAVFKRVGRDSQGYWIDVCDAQWQAILVTATGWQLCAKPGVRFTRTKAMRPLPYPATSGNLGLLWELVNIPSEDQPLVLAWMIEAYRSDTPYAVLELIGEQGSAKSSTQEVLRNLIDPNQVNLRGKPKTVEDVYIAAKNNHVVSLENLSGITADISDALCTIATGGGSASRTFYTNGEESILEVHGPVVINGISAVITRSDLLDRTVALCLPTIKVRQLESGEDGLDARFERHSSGIFGAILDLFSQALLQLPNVNIAPELLPRMADFAILGEAISLAQGHPAGIWLDLYKDHRRDAIRRTIDSSPVAVQCIDFVERGHKHQGTVKQLLEKLTQRMEQKSLEHGDYWPRSPKGFADSLRRAAPALRQMGIYASVDAKPKNDGVHCTLKKGEHETPEADHVDESLNRRNSSSPSSPKFTAAPEDGHSEHETEVFEI